MVNLTPFGYKNARDEQGNIIVIDPVKSKIVEKIFADFFARCFYSQHPEILYPTGIQSEKPKCC